MPENPPTNVAIACQGGGSHTAFTAGVLKRLFRDWDEEYKLVGISGTSGGAINALAAWYGLVTADFDRSIELLDSVWEDLSVDAGGERLLNDWVVAISRMQDMGFPIPQISPYQVPGPELGKAKIRTILESHFDFDAIPTYCRRDAPELVIGTVDINAGEFETFVNEAVTQEAVLASAAVPTMFEAVEIDGHYHWDGLFSQNPPVDDLMTLESKLKPDELWIIQINPQRLDGEPTSLESIADRRNQLSGNISLNQELRFIRRVNEWVEEGHLPEREFSQTTIRRISMGTTYSASTKVDRRRGFIRELMDLGDRRAQAFIEEEMNQSSGVDEPQSSSAASEH